MDGHNRCLPLYSKLIEESLRGETTYYRPDHIAFTSRQQRFREFDHDRHPGDRRLLYVRLAGMPVLRMRLPRWVSVRMVTF